MCGVTSGTLTAASGGGVTVSGSGTATLTLSGTLDDLNTYLAGASRPDYVPAADHNGTVTLTLTTDDGGNTGLGGALSDVDTSTITIAPVADVVDDSAVTNEDTAVTISVLSNDTFSDPGRTITAGDSTSTTPRGAAGGAGGVLPSAPFSTPGGTSRGVDRTSIPAGGAGVAVAGGTVTLNTSGQLI